MIDADIIQGWHAHIYFDAESVETAGRVLDACEARFDLKRGRMHHRPVGPHPMWSCQLGCGPEVFAELLPWLTLNRAGLTVFAHPETDDPFTDHADRAVWLGPSRELDLDTLRRALAEPSS